MYSGSFGQRKRQQIEEREIVIHCRFVLSYWQILTWSGHSSSNMLNKVGSEPTRNGKIRTKDDEISMQVYLGNAFSIQMMAEDLLSGQKPVVNFEIISLEEAKAMIAGGFISTIGHQDLADRASDLLGTNVAMNRVNNTLKKGDSYLMLQVFGGRLPEGTKELPAGVRLEWVKVTML